MVIVDFKMGNLGSVANMLKKIGASVEISADPARIDKADRLILPGVGRFDTAMENLRQMNLYQVLVKKIKIDKIPTMGVCLGMQLLGRFSEEGHCEGLGVIPSEIKKFDFSTEKEPLRVPHMGWNYIEPRQTHPVLRGLDEESRFYFVHSYYAVALDPAVVLTETEYGLRFASGLACQNVVGFQFHPEKSHKFGMSLYRNFVEWTP